MTTLAPPDFEPADSFYSNGVGEHAPANDHVNGSASAEPVKPAIVFLDHDDLFAPEARNENLVVPELGIGAGPPIGLFGQGYVGKTIMAMSLGMAVALGKGVWGKFPTKPGTWVHFDYEQGRRETKKRIQRLARGFGVDKEELRGQLRIAIYPSVNLTTADALKHYIEAMRGAGIATVDALKGITPGVEENSSAMRDHMRILSVASEQTGCAVLLIHHAGLTKPGRARKEMGRGSSAIYDECQSVFVVTGEKAGDKRITHEKDRELGELVAEFGLRFEDAPDVADADTEETVDEGGEDVSLEDRDPRGGLRVIVVGAVAAQHMDRIVRYLAGHGGAFEGSRTDLVGETEMNRSDFYKALRELEGLKRVLVQGKSQKENRPKGRISLISKENEDSSHRPTSSREDRDDFDRSPGNRPADPSFKDGRDDGTILKEDGTSTLENV
jgi:hypothetical protein